MLQTLKTVSVKLENERQLTFNEQSAFQIVIYICHDNYRGYLFIVYTAFE